jgi:exopolysaccharide production protein ExoQ
MRRWYHWVATFFILETIEAFSIADRLLYGEWVGKPGDKLTQGLNSLMIVVSLCLLWRGFHQVRPIRTGAILAIALVGFFFLTALWSIDPKATETRALLYLFMVIGAIGIVANFEADEFMDLLSKTCFLAAVASLALLIVSPADAHAGEDFRGIFSQKNTLGEAMTIGALASLHGLRVGDGKRLRSIIILVFVTIVAMVSKSMTSLLTIFVFCSADTVIALIRRGGLLRIIGILGSGLALPVVVFAAAFPDSVLEMIGKDPTLTGRTDLWAYVIADIYQRPWLGWGFLAFWSPLNPAAAEIGDTFHWFAPQAHNGLLEMLLNVGVIGTVLLICFWIRSVRLALRCLRTSEKASAISGLMLCAGLVLVGITETVLLVPFEASTCVFYVTGFFCERAIWVARRRHVGASFMAPRADGINRSYSHEFMFKIEHSANSLAKSDDLA